MDNCHRINIFIGIWNFNGMYSFIPNVSHFSLNLKALSYEVVKLPDHFGSLSKCKEFI